LGGWGEGGQPRIRQGLLGVQANMLQAVQVPPVVKTLQSVWMQVLPRRVHCVRGPHGPSLWLHWLSSTLVVVYQIYAVKHDNFFSPDLHYSKN